MSYDKGNGKYVHTLNTEKNLIRKLNAMGKLEVLDYENKNLIYNIVY